MLPLRPRWQPILFGALIQAIGKRPWSLRAGPDRDRQMRACERRAAALGLALRWPREWPLGTYSPLAARAALVADRLGRVREFSLAAFEQGLGLGRDLSRREVVLEATEAAGLDVRAVADGVQRAEVKRQLRSVTEAARRAGVTGIPTVSVAGELYWGDDRLEDAAAALAAHTAAPDRVQSG